MVGLGMHSNNNCLFASKWQIQKWSHPFVLLDTLSPLPMFLNFLLLLLLVLWLNGSIYLPCNVTTLDFGRLLHFLSLSCFAEWSRYKCVGGRVRNECFKDIAMYQGFQFDAPWPLRTQKCVSLRLRKLSPFLKILFLALSSQGSQKSSQMVLCYDETDNLLCCK